MDKNLIGIGSFAYRYQIGIAGFTPEKPFTAYDVIDDAISMGLGRVQLCENLKYAVLPYEELCRIAQYAKDKNVVIELGAYGATYENLTYHLKLAELFGARFLRIAAGDEEDGVCLEPKKLADTMKKALDDAKSDVVIGIENHFDLTTRAIAQTVVEANDARIGAVYDTTNSIRLIEQPEETLEILLPHVKSAHLKDFRMDKTEASITMNGTVWGEGILKREKILKTLRENCPGISYIAELTIRRADNVTTAQAAETERYNIHTSVERILKDII